MRFGAFDIWGVSSAVKFLSISVTLGFCAHSICGLHGTSLQAPWLLTAPQECEEEMLLGGPPHSAWNLVGASLLRTAQATWGEDGQSQRLRT